MPITFTIEMIRIYLITCKDLEDAWTNISEESVMKSFNDNMNPTDWDLYAGNEAGAFDYLDEMQEAKETNNMTDAQYEEWCNKKGYGLIIKNDSK